MIGSASNGLSKIQIYEINKLFAGLSPVDFFFAQKGLKTTSEVSLYIFKFDGLMRIFYVFALIGNRLCE